MKRLFAAFAVLAIAASAARAEDADEAEYQRRYRSAANAVAKLQRFAARWCADHGLHAAAFHEWQESLELEPDSEDARKALGFERKKGEWVRDESVTVEMTNDGGAKEIEENLEVYRKKRAGIVAAAQRELAPLAEWAGDRGFGTRSKRLWELVRTFDPFNANACEAVGWKDVGNRWFPPGEAAARKAQLELVEKGDGGEAQKKASDLTDAMEAKLERRRSAHFTFEGRATQKQLGEWLRGAEAARQMLFELLPADEQKRAGHITAVFLNSRADHVKFLEKCTPLEEDDRKTYEMLGGWNTFSPSIAYELWTPGDMPEYHREAAIHVGVHMMFQSTFGLAKPPPWLGEGFALWFTDRLTGSALARCTDLMGNKMGEDRSASTAGWRARFRTMLREGSAPTPKALFRAHNDDLTMDKLIASWSLVSFLADNPERFRKFIALLSEGGDPTDSLFEALGVKDYDEVQRQWEEWVLANS